MATPANIYSTVRNQASEEGTSFVGETELYRYMSLAESEIARKLLCYKTTDSTLATVASTKEYTIPAGTIAIFRAEWDSYPLKKIDRSQVDAYEGISYGGVTSTGKPVLYYEWGANIGLCPTPNAVKTIKLWIAKVPTALSSSSTDFTIPAELADNIPDYCLHRIYLKDGNQAIADYHLRMWNDGLARAEAEYLDKKYQGMLLGVKDEDAMVSTTLGAI